MKKMATSKPFKTILEMATAFKMTQKLYVVAELGIPDLLAEKPMGIDDLAKKTGANPDRLYRLLRNLTDHKFFAQTEKGEFYLTPLTSTLRSDAPGSLRSFLIMLGNQAMWYPWGNLLHTLKTGQSGAEFVYGVSPWEYRKRVNPEAGRLFDEGLAGQIVWEAQSILKSYDFSSFQTIVDIGGGNGALLAVLLRAYPWAAGILFEQNSEIQRARETLSSSGITERCQLVAGDFFEPGLIPRGGDAYVLKYVLHDWEDDAKAAQILFNCRKAMHSRAKLLIIERVLGEAANVPALASDMDVIVMVMEGGRERSLLEYEKLLLAAKFRLATKTHASSDLYILECIPV